MTATIEEAREDASRFSWGSYVLQVMRVIALTEAIFLMALLIVLAVVALAGINAVGESFTGFDPGPISEEPADCWLDDSC